MRVRYNFLVHFFRKEDKIIFIFTNKKISISYSRELYKVLIDILQKTFIEVSYVRNIGISKNVIKFLIQSGIFLETTSGNSGGESLLFHSLANNPNKVDHSLEAKSILEIYQEYQESKNTVNWNNYDEIKIEYKLKENLDGSSRLLKTEKEVNYGYLEKCLSSITQYQNNKKQYGSGGGFYSVDQVIITRDDLVYIGLGYKGRIFKGKFLGIFLECSNGILSDETYNVNGYNGIVFLITDLTYVLRKYGNRGYRFALIESGAIGLLYREHYSRRGYLELGGYNDSLCKKALQRLSIIKQENCIITHCILINH